MNEIPPPDVRLDGKVRIVEWNPSPRETDKDPPTKEEPPRPLTRKIPPGKPFPVEALGNVLGPAASAIHDRIQAPFAIGAQSVLAAATLAAQSHADVVLPIGPDGQKRPLSNFFVTIAASGERKSSCDYEATWPVRKYEATLREEYDEALPAYRNDHEAWQSARNAAKKNKKTKKEIAAALELIGPEPAAPLKPVLTCTEPTFEGLCRLFAEGHPSLAIVTTEGGSFIGGYGMSEDHKLRTISGLSQLWDGEPIRRVRAIDGTSILPGRRLACHLMVQPQVADQLLNDPLIQGQGILSRFLVTAPDSTIGQRMQRREAAWTDKALKHYGAHLLNMLEARPNLAPEKTNELAPRNLPLSQEATELWRQFSDQTEMDIGPGGRLQSVRHLGNKIPEHAARLAGVLQLTDDLHAGEINAEHLNNGIALAAYYAQEAIRLAGASCIAAPLRLAQELLNWLQQRNKKLVSLPDVYQHGPYAIRDATTARQAVVNLESHGWLHKVQDGAMVDGVPRRDVWRLVSESS